MPGQTYEDEVRSLKRRLFRPILSSYALQLFLSLTIRVVSYISGLALSPEVASLFLSVSKDASALINEGRTLESLEALCRQIDKIRVEADPKKIRKELLELKKEVQSQLDEIFLSLEEGLKDEVKKRQVERRLGFLIRTLHKAEEASLKIDYPPLTEPLKEIRNRVQNGKLLLDLLSDREVTLFAFDPESFRAALLEKSPNEKKIKIIGADGSLLLVLTVKDVRVRGPKAIVVRKDKTSIVLSKKSFLSLSLQEIESTILGRESERNKRLKRTCEENLKYSKKLFWASKRRIYLR